MAIEVSNMILFVDDEPQRIANYIEAVQDRGHATVTLPSVQKVMDFLTSGAGDPGCIVLDIMFPGDDTLPGAMTDNGLRTGNLLFASLRSRFPKTHIVVFTNACGVELAQFYQDQDNCSFYSKAGLLPSDLAGLIDGIVKDLAQELLSALAACPKGKATAHEFELLAVRILKYLFVPPFKDIHYQSRRSDGRTIRDAIMSNDVSQYFWTSLRSELGAKHIVVEFKNYADSIEKKEVLQLLDYISRKTIGRFGLLVSRFPPSASAIAARRDAFEHHECLILFLHDDHIREMCELRRNGDNPAIILQRMKEAFELEY